MSKEKSVDPNSVLPGNVKVKVEPGTSMPVPIKNIKTEPGLSSTTRLTSFRLPRDLTLGGNIKSEKPKKIYTPNLNAQRNKNKDNAFDKQDGARSSKQKDRGRGRGRGDRGRGRGTPLLIQSKGVFSEGITEVPGGMRKYSNYRDSEDRKESRCSLEKPKLNLDHIINKAEEEEKLKVLLRDDFIDDGFDPNIDNAPVMLPMVEGKLYKEETNKGTSIDNDEEEDKKPIILEDGQVMKAKEVKLKIKSSVHKRSPPTTTIPQIIESKTNSYMLIQFPDCLPGLELNSDANEPKSKHLGNASLERGNNGTSKTEYCTLNSLKGGMLGKLQILKSGKARLCLGENNLIVDIGSTLSFRQDLIAAKVDTVKLNGELVNLGPISSTLICSPDWESMLAKL